MEKARPVLHMKNRRLEEIVQLLIEVGIISVNTHDMQHLCQLKCLRAEISAMVIGKQISVFITLTGCVDE